MSPVAAGALVDLAEAAVGQRAEASAELVAALGHAPPADPRIVWGWPSKILADPEASAFPLLTFLGARDRERRTGWGVAEVQIDEWVWLSGAGGGVGVLRDLDRIVYNLFSEAHWKETASGVWIHGQATSPTSFPPEHGQPLRRMRRIELGVG